MIPRPMSDAPAQLDNAALAAALAELAELLEAQGANRFRVAAWRHGADAVARMEVSVADVLALDGVPGLRHRLHVGESVARSIQQLSVNGRLGLLERLRGHHGSEEVLATVPGVGPTLAALIHDELGVETLPDLEMAAHDGRLASLPGFGKRRVQAVAESLAGRFRRGRVRPERAPPHGHGDVPPVEEILSVDEEYRALAGRGKLPKIAPKRFNPTGEAWLPILHAERGERHYTALFSNTARAHALAKTRDWVVIYRDDPEGHQRWTVVTEHAGPQAGKRVVRGRESEGLHARA